MQVLSCVSITLSSCIPSTNLELISVTWNVACKPVAGLSHIHYQCSSIGGVHDVHCVNKYVGIHMYLYMVQFCTLKDWGVQDWGVPLYHNGGSTIISCSEVSWSRKVICWQRQLKSNYL